MQAINQALLKRPTSTGLRYRLRWQPLDGRQGTQALSTRLFALFAGRILPHAEKAAEVLATTNTSAQTLDDPMGFADCAIAARASAHGCAVATRNIGTAGSADRRLASTQPAAPVPTMMQSNPITRGAAARSHHKVTGHLTGEPQREVFHLRWRQVADRMRSVAGFE